MVFDFNRMLSPDRIIDLKGSSKTDILKEVTEVICRSPLVTDPKALYTAVTEREKIVSTGIGIGIAVPHVKIPSIKDFVIAIGRSHKGVEFDALDGKPVHIIVLIAASDQQAGDYLKVMARFMLALKKPEFRRQVLLLKSPDEVYEAFLDELNSEKK